MMLTAVLHHLSTGVLVASLGYLLWRTLRQVALQRRSYQAIPFGAVEHVRGADARQDRARAALIGVALGDALGMPREMLPPWLVRWRYGRGATLSRGVVRFMRRRGTVSDDTQLTLATARAVDSHRHYQPDVFRAALVDWLDYAIGPGRATLRAARGWAAGADRRDRRSQGNGAAMRVVPLAIAYRDDRDALLAALQRDAEQTHPNAEAVAGAEAMGRLIAHLLQLDAGLDAERLVEIMLPCQTSESLDDWEVRLRLAVTQARDGGPLARVGTSGWVKETVPAVVYLLVASGDDPERGLSALFSAGGDVDTIAALYLAGVGAWRGTEVFPREWIDPVQGVPSLIEEADRLSRL